MDFPLTGMVGLLIRMADGSHGGMITVGSEGFAGVSVLLDTDTHMLSMVQQLGGRVAAVPAAAFRQAVEANPRLRRLTRRYVVYLLRLLQQTLACERTHSLKERTSLWLLRVHAWMHDDSFVLTQDALAAMLSVRRQSVSEASQELQQAGCIAISAQIRIIDAERLARSACPCFPTLNLAYDRLMRQSRSLSVSVR